MEHSDGKGAGASADNTEGSTSSSDSETASAAMGPQQWPNTAIERQIARVSVLGSRKRTHQEAPGYRASPRKARYNAGRRKYRRIGLVSFIVLFLLIAAGLALIFSDLGRPAQKVVSDPLPAVEKAASIANASPTVEPKKIVEASTPAAISVPIADVSLQNRPELLEQLVQVYRSQLANDPHASAAQSALNQLQERSLSELQTIIANGDQATAIKSLEIASRLFPELTDNTRYKYLMTRIDYMTRPQKDEPAAAAGPSTSSATATPAETTKPATIERASTAPIKSVSPSIEALPAVAKNTAIKTTSSKPEIGAVSITPGTMIDDRFTPGDDGNMFMVEVSYRNFDKAFVDKTEATLVTRLGIPGDPIVLAEVPVVISADRGTKVFLMETFVQAHAGGKFQLNFILDDKFLTSRTLRLSMPGR